MGRRSGRLISALAEIDRFFAVDQKSILMEPRRFDRVVRVIDAQAQYILLRMRYRRAQPHAVQPHRRPLGRLFRIRHAGKLRRCYAPDQVVHICKRQAERFDRPKQPRPAGAAHADAVDAVIVFLIGIQLHRDSRSQIVFLFHHSISSPK